MFDFVAVPAIAVVCYLCGEIFKIFMPEKRYRFIPTFCGAMGLVLGVVAFIAWPGYIPAENPLVAAAIGVVSGFASTGVHQVIKQLKP